VVALVPDAYAGRRRTTQLDWQIPVGATAVTIATDAAAQLHVDGTPINGDNGRYALPATAQRAQLTLTAHHGGAGAALLQAPLTYQWDEGSAALPASFADLGLGDFAGAVAFTRMIDVNDINGQWVLDLGVVRGTAEVLVNGESVGARIWSPYQFDISNNMIIRPNQITHPCDKYLGTVFGWAQSHALHSDASRGEWALGADSIETIWSVERKYRTCGVGALPVCLHVLLTPPITLLLRQ
jgi:hypothetical protein